MINNRNENFVVNDNKKKNEFDFHKFNDNVTHNLSIGRNSNDLMLRWRKKISHESFQSFFTK